MAPELRKLLVVNSTSIVAKYSHICYLGFCMFKINTRPISGLLLLSSFFMLNFAHSLTLQESLDSALNTNTNLKAAQSGLQYTQYTQDQALTFTKPYLDISYNAQSVHTQNTTLSSHAANIRLSQTLLNLNKLHQLKNVQDLVQSQKHHLSHTQMLLTYNVANVYFNLLNTQSIHTNMLSKSNAILQEYKKVKLYYDYGTLPITTYHEAKAAHHHSKTELIQSSNNKKNAQNQFSLLTGISTPAITKSKPSKYHFSSSSFPEDLSHWKKTALDNSLQLKAADSEYQSAQHQLHASKMLSTPVISASLNYNDSHCFNSACELSAMNTTNDQYSASLQLTLPIYTGGYNKAETLKASSKLEQTFYMNDQLQQDILQELELTFNNWLMFKASINAHNTLLNSAQLKLKTVRYSYQNGSRTLNDLLNATTDLYLSKINYNNSIYRYILSGLKLKLLSGTLSKEDLATVDDWFAN
jgi:outer membrane protein